MFSNSQDVSSYFIALTLLILCSFPAAANAQEVACKVSLASLPAAPELKGFHLGMTKEEAKQRAPLMAFRPDDSLGSTKTTINPAFDPNSDKSEFQDIRTISFEFLDGRLVSLWIGYDRNFKWTKVDDFVAGISKSLTLPNAWSDWKSNGKRMICKDFELSVSLIAQTPSFRIVDNAAAETLAERRNAAAEDQTSEAHDSESEEIVANRKTKIYYLVSCRPPGPIADADKVIFKNSVEAEKAGYTLSKSCS